MHIELDDLSRPAVHDLLNEHLQSMYALSPPESVHALDLDKLRSPDITFWTAWSDAIQGESPQLLGCGALKRLSEKHGEIKSMRTPNALRRRGAGRALLAHIVAVARERGYERLSLETGTVPGFEPAQKLYESFGFAACGPFAGYLEDPYSLFLTLRLLPQPAPSRPSSLLSLFAYKAWANTELLAVLAGVDVAAYPAEVHNAIRILNHVYVTDSIFSAHLQGVTHGYVADNTPGTPSLQALTAAVNQLDAWYVSYASGLAPAALSESISFAFTDADRGRMSREEILLHVLTHGNYHRGAVGQVLRSAGATPPRDVYTRFLHSAEPQRRG